VIPLIYVAGPFTAETTTGVHANICEAAAWGHQLRKRGFGVIVPHLIGAPYVGHGHSLPDSFGYEWWIKETKEQLRRCDVAFFTPRWRESSGARGENADAQERKQDRLYTLAEAEAWIAKWREARRLREAGLL
jgi:hypothetical protein